MRKILSLSLVALFAIALLGCATANGSGAQLSGTEAITMENVDMYLDSGARFIDMRNYDDALRDGYIAGFEIIPFFQYIEGRALVRNDGWNFSPEDIVDQALLENLFGPKDTVLVGMCMSGTRCGYVFDALAHIGYTNLINAGGLRDYNGVNLVEGDGEWRGVAAIPAEGVSMDNIDNFLNRPGAKYVDLRNAIQQYTDGYIDGFVTISFFEFIEGQEIVVRSNGWNFSPSDVKDDFMLEALFGDRDREIFLICQGGTRAEYIKLALESIGYTSVYNAGGIGDYAGANRVPGDPSFSF